MQIAETTKKMTAITHQLDGRHAYFPSTIPAEKNSAAQKSGCRAETCFLPRELRFAGRTEGAGAGRLTLSSGAAIFVDANLKRQFYEARRNTLSMWKVCGNKSMKWASVMRYPKPAINRKSRASVEGSHETYVILGAFSFARL